MESDESMEVLKLEPSRPYFFPDVYPPRDLSIAIEDDGALLAPSKLPPKIISASELDRVYWLVPNEYFDASLRFDVALSGTVVVEMLVEVVSVLKP